MAKKSVVVNDSMDEAVLALVKRSEEKKKEAPKKDAKSSKAAAPAKNTAKKASKKAPAFKKPAAQAPAEPKKASRTPVKELPEHAGGDEKPKKKAKAPPEPKKPKGVPVYRCTECEDMTKVLTPSCRACGTPNGYQLTPSGTKLPKKRHGLIKQPHGIGASFGGDDLFSGGSDSPGRKKDDDDDGDFDPDDEPDVMAIGDVETEERVRISTGIPAFDRVLGGNDEDGFGIVAGSSVMIDGSPGIGKSTLLIQALAKLAEDDTVLYVTGEEAASDIKARGARLGILSKKVKKNLLVVETTDTDAIINIMEEEEPIAVILDSIQMFYADDVSGQAGSEPQCKYILEELIRGTAKPMGIAVFVVSQVTKDGNARGPETIAHMVDAHLKFESTDPKNKGETKRVLHQKKNRNGDISIMSYFRMTGEGLKSLKPSKKTLAAMEDDDD